MHTHQKLTFNSVLEFFICVKIVPFYIFYNSSSPMSPCVVCCVLCVVCILSPNPLHNHHSISLQSRITSNMLFFFLDKTYPSSSVVVGGNTFSGARGILYALACCSNSSWRWKPEARVCNMLCFYCCVRCTNLFLLLSVWWVGEIAQYCVQLLLPGGSWCLGFFLFVLLRLPCRLLEIVLHTK